MNNNMNNMNTNMANSHANLMQNIGIVGDTTPNYSEQLLLQVFYLLQANDMASAMNLLVSADVCFDRLVGVIGALGGEDCHAGQRGFLKDQVLGLTTMQ